MRGAASADVRAVAQRRGLIAESKELGAGPALLGTTNEEMMKGACAAKVVRALDSPPRKGNSNAEHDG